MSEVADLPGCGLLSLRRAQRNSAGRIRVTTHPTRSRGARRRNCFAIRHARRARRYLSQRAHYTRLVRFTRLARFVRSIQLAAAKLEFGIHWCYAEKGGFEADFLEVQAEEKLQAPLECSAVRPDGDRHGHALRITNCGNSGIGAYDSEAGGRRVRRLRQEDGPDRSRLSRAGLARWVFDVTTTINQSESCKPGVNSQGFIKSGIRSRSFVR